MTAGGIREAFQTLRDGEEMAGLADAARSRSESDWLIGINGTRAITKRMFGSRGGNVASVGRVQTPTLAIVFNRELEIRNFKPRDYWRVTAKFEIAKGTYEGVYQRPDFKKEANDEHDRIDRVWDKALAEAVARRLPGPAARQSLRGEKIIDASFAASLRSHHAAARSERPLRPFRQAHPADRAGTLRAPQGHHLSADRFARPAGRLYPDLSRDLGQTAGRSGRARPDGSGKGLAPPEQAHLQQRADLRSLRHHPDRHRAEASRRDGKQSLRHDRAAFRRRFFPGGGI